MLEPGAAEDHCQLVDAVAPSGSLSDAVSDCPASTVPEMATAPSSLALATVTVKATRSSMTVSAAAAASFLSVT